MKLDIKLPGLKIFFTAFRTKKAYGLTSQVATEHGCHFLLMDFDQDIKLQMKILKNLRARGFDGWMVSYPTEHGFHIIVLEALEFTRAAIEMLSTPWVDTTHVSFGLKRKYWFLEVPHEAMLALNALDPRIQPMVIERGGKN